MPTHIVKALAAQAAGLILVYSLGQNGWLPALPAIGLALLQGVLAASAALLLSSPRWWLPIHFLFCPALVLASASGLPTWLYGATFLALCLIYWSSFRTQVPLFLSNRITVHRLAASLPSSDSLKVLDAGSGTGSFVRHLARLRPNWKIRGLESAPAPLWLSRWLARKTPAAQLQRGDIWAHPFGEYDLVYAFLSPVPMPALWRKARKEMKAGSLLVSNSFAIPDVKPESIIKIDDRRQTRLYCYRIPGTKPTKP
ncbi:class I SAM-dependent methyltransferase [Uliginosibacterium aquaticum]|uniref:Class I SAM-dependent methyltransferase n=1 Tax=Uliginosibacterium aquaticum TaxID=2731212 RepID=A0ABX2ICU9_9RHOO|nr:class I SAM-dependent methyltransferase [Uliginosibacterium aquaticum]NSL53842.1 class I SAM-dependent methyltransferase [Uliginosibacterium aquaticum]